MSKLTDNNLLVADPSFGENKFKIFEIIINRQAFDETDYWHILSYLLDDESIFLESQFRQLNRHFRIREFSYVMKNV